MNQPNKRPHGQLRHSQVVTTFGPGSLVDLPTQSAIVGGLDHWFQVNDEIHEPRLIEKLKRLLNLQTLKLFSPPADNEDPSSPRTGLTAWQFPEWFIAQNVTRGEQGAVRSRHLVQRRALSKGKFIDEDKKRTPSCRCDLFGHVVRDISATSTGVVLFIRAILNALDHFGLTSAVRAVTSARSSFAVSAVLSAV